MCFFRKLLEKFGEFGNGSEVETTTNEYFVNAHWALYCENYLEGFHIPFVHGGLSKEIEFETYKTELGTYSSLQTAESRKIVHQTDADSYALAFANGAAAFYFFVFPNLMFNFYPWGLSVNVVEPVTIESRA